MRYVVVFFYEGQECATEPLFWEDAQKFRIGWENHNRRLEGEGREPYVTSLRLCRVAQIGYPAPE